MMMRRSGLVMGALALQAMVANASVGTGAPGVSGVHGAGWRETFACAGCALAGVALVASGGAEGVALALMIGGSEAVALASAAATCVGMCVAAVE